MIANSIAEIKIVLTLKLTLTLTLTITLTLNLTLILVESQKIKPRNAWQSLAYNPLGAVVSPPSGYL